ncbi:MAG TPA: hypothetical protein VLR88_07765 [Propionibacteriaceae bacterium]|nr:hypothetical protein [Propionibacteriaceae bacterium]
MKPASALMIHVRNATNWCNLSTPAGLVVASVGGARIRRGPRGLFIAEGYRWNVPKASAWTLGSVIATKAPDFDALATRFPDLLDHEEAHTWQYAYSLGLGFLPVYSGMAAWSWLRTGDHASANFYERQAGLVNGGYAQRPVRPVRAGIRALADLRNRVR